jgi:hypothetical protein
MIRVRNITLQESGICNIHPVESSASALLNGLTGTLRQPRLSQKKGLVHPANGWERHHPHNRLFRDPKSLWINKMRVYVCGQGLLAYLSLSKHHGRVGGPHSDTVFVRWWTILILDRTRQPPERRFVMPARARQASDARIHTSRTPCRGITRVRKVVGTRPGVWQGGHSAIAIPASAERV